SATATAGRQKTSAASARRSVEFMSCVLSWMRGPAVQPLRRSGCGKTLTQEMDRARHQPARLPEAEPKLPRSQDQNWMGTPDEFHDVHLWTTSTHRTAR